MFIVYWNCKLRVPAELVVYTNCCFCFVLTFRTILVRNMFCRCCELLKKNYLYVLRSPSGTYFSFRHLEEHYWKKNSWKLTWDKFCITCCFRKVFHLSNTLVINSESLVNRFKPDSIQAMVSKSTLHPLCLIVQARFSFFASHEIELVVIEAAEAQWFQIAWTR